MNSARSGPDRSMWTVGCLVVSGVLAGSIGAGKLWGVWAGVLCGGIMSYVGGLWMGYLVSKEDMAERRREMLERRRTKR